MAGCNGHVLGQTSGDGEGQRDLAYGSPWGLKESDRTGKLNNSIISPSHFSSFYVIFFSTIYKPHELLLILKCPLQSAFL